MEFVSHIFGKARTQRYNFGVVTYGIGIFRDDDFGCKVHSVFLTFQKYEIKKTLNKKPQILHFLNGIFEVLIDLLIFENYFTNSTALAKASAIPSAFFPPAVAKNG